MNPADNIWQVALALILIIGVVMLLGYLAKRFQFTKGKTTGQLKVVDSAYLGPKEKLVLVQIANQNVLLGMNSQCITKLAEFDASETFAGALDKAQGEIK